MPPKMRLVAQREFFHHLRRRLYLFTAFGVPLIIMASTYLAVVLVVDSASNLDKFEKVGVVDKAGALSRPLEDKTPARFIPYSDETEAEADVQAGELGGYFVLPSDYMLRGEVRFISPSGLPEQLLEEFQTFLVNSLIGEQSDNPALQRAANPVEITIQVLGTENELSTEAAILRFSLPLIIGFLLVVNVTISAQFLMSGLVDERENFILEILMTSLRPIDLMAGKVLGLGALALLQISFWLGASLLMGALTGRLGILSEARFGADFWLVALTFAVLYFFLFTGIMLGIGAIAAAEQEARQFAGIFTMIAILPPSWGMGVILENPESPLAIVMGLFPLTSPITMMTLIAVDSAPLWLVISSLVLLAASLVGVLWLTAKLFRLGMLSAGQRLSWRAIREGLWS